MFRVKVISKLAEINENIIFYPKLKNLYKKNVANSRPVILDVGTNKGQSIDFFLKVFKDCTIYGFEPNKTLCNFLWDKYKGLENIKIMNCGVSETNGTLVLNETVTNETSTFEELNYNSDYLRMKSRVLGIKPENMITSKYEVDVISLSDFIRENGIEKVDVLKIDTEGHEYKCLCGLFNGTQIQIDFIQLEHHNDDMYAKKVSSEQIDKLLAENGFDVFKILSHGFGDFEEKIYKSTK